MTIEEYNRATSILEEKKQLEAELMQVEDKVMQVRDKLIIDCSYIGRYIEITNKLFDLGQEFAAL